MMTSFFNSRSPVLFDQMIVDNKPSILPGTVPTWNLTHWYWFEYDKEAKRYLTENGVSEEVMRRNIPRALASYLGRLYTCNIEAWNFTTTFGMAARGLSEIFRALTLFEKIAPDEPRGIYRLLPTREYTAFDNPISNREWQLRNDLVYELLQDKLDYICPSLYWNPTLTPTAERWLEFAEANLAEAKRCANGLPICAYMSPRVWPMGKDDPLIEYDLFKSQLEFVLDQGCNAVLWDTRWREPWQEIGAYKAIVDVIKERVNPIILG